MAFGMYKKTDEELVREVKEGHITSYEVLVRRFEKRVYQYALRFVKRGDDAKDIVQDAFIGVYEHLEKFDEKRSFSAYLYRVVKNGAISFLRKQKRLTSLHRLEIVDETEEQEEALIKKLRSRSVRQAIDALDGKYKKVINLYYFDDLSYEEIARKLVMPINTVRTYIRRAKIRLRSHLIHEKH